MVKQVAILALLAASLAEANTAPSVQLRITSRNHARLNVGEPVRLTAIASDPEGDPVMIQFFIAGIGAWWYAVNPERSLWVFAPLSKGRGVITIWATDPQGARATATQVVCVEIPASQCFGPIARVTDGRSRPDPWYVPALLYSVPAVADNYFTDRGLARGARELNPLGRDARVRWIVKTAVVGYAAWVDHWLDKRGRQGWKWAFRVAVAGALATVAGMNSRF